MPTTFRRHLEERYGKEVFITSVLGDSVLVYPLSVVGRHRGSPRGSSVDKSDKQRFLERVSYYGQQGRLDGQGRVVIPPAAERKRRNGW